MRDFLRKPVYTSSKANVNLVLRLDLNRFCNYIIQIYPCQLGQSGSKYSKSGIYPLTCGKGKNRAYEWRANKPKEVVFGIVQRRGKAYLKHIPNTNMYTLINQVRENIHPKAFVMSDDYQAYKRLYEYGYNHHYSVNHSYGEYVKWHGLVHNTIEFLWSQFKRGIYGVYRNVSKKYLQAYVDEYTWRYNNRRFKERMFDRLLRQITEVTSLKAVQPA